MSSLGKPFSLSMSGVHSEFRKTQFFTSRIVLSKSGTVKNYLFCSILSDTLLEDGLPVSECTGGMCHFAILQ